MLFRSGINYVCIISFGFVGAAIGSIFIIMLFNGVRGGFLYYKMQLQPFSNSTWKAIIIALFVFIIDSLIPHYQYNRYFTFADVLLHSTVIVALFGAAILYFKVSEDITAFAERWKKKLI